MPGTLSSRILIFVEDPGAANYIAPAIPILESNGVQVRFLAQGDAATYLAHRRVGFEAMPSGINVAELLQQWRPELLALGTAENPRTAAWDLLNAACQLRVPSVAFVDSGVNARFRFRGLTDNPLNHCPDFLIVPDSFTVSEFRNLGVNAERIFACGHPNHDRVRAFGKSCIRQSSENDVEKKKRKRKVVFLSELSDAIGGGVYERTPDYSFRGKPDRPLRTHVVLAELALARETVLDNSSWTLRLHPKQALQDVSEFVQHFDNVSQGGDPLEAIADADLVVGMTTALLDEAALLGIPTLAILPRSIEREWNASIQWGATATAESRQELRKQLQCFVNGECLQRENTTCLPPQGAALSVESKLRELVKPFAAGDADETQTQQIRATVTSPCLQQDADGVEMMQSTPSGSPQQPRQAC